MGLVYGLLFIAGGAGGFHLKWNHNPRPFHHFKTATTVFQCHEYTLSIHEHWPLHLLTRLEPTQCRKKINETYDAALVIPFKSCQVPTYGFVQRVCEVTDSSVFPNKLQCLCIYSFLLDICPYFVIITHEKSVSKPWKDCLMLDACHMWITIGYSGKFWHGPINKINLIVQPILQEKKDIFWTHNHLEFLVISSISIWIVVGSIKTLLERDQAPKDWQKHDKFCRWVSGSEWRFFMHTYFCELDCGMI